MPSTKFGPSTFDLLSPSKFSRTSPGFNNIHVSSMFSNSCRTDSIGSLTKNSDLLSPLNYSMPLPGFNVSSNNSKAFSKLKRSNSVVKNSITPEDIFLP